MTRLEYVQTAQQLARERFHEPGVLEIDEDPDIADGNSNGLYVQAWVWVDFAGTPLDKEKHP